MTVILVTTDAEERRIKKVGGFSWYYLYGLEQKATYLVHSNINVEEVTKEWMKLWKCRLIYAFVFFLLVLVIDDSS